MFERLRPGVLMRVILAARRTAERLSTSLAFRSRRRFRRVLFRILGTSSSGRTWVFSQFARRSWLAHWGAGASVSGPGSTLEQTETIRRRLPEVWAELGIRSLLDIPCGDGHWIRTINHHLDAYIGGDIVPSLIESLRESALTHESFEVLDVVIDELPNAQAVLCRDLFVHLPDTQVRRAIRNIRDSGARYLIATTFPGRTNRPGVTGGWRPIDLEAPPFGLGRPLIMIDERCTEEGGAFADKALGIWSLDAIRRGS